MAEDRAWELFLELHSGNPREGPGGPAFTERAFRMLPPLPDEPRVLDIGCGPGMQSLDLCRLTGGHITAVDKFPQFLEQLRNSARKSGLENKLSAVQGDMAALDFPKKTFDLLWAEACIYIVGFEKGLRLWRPLLAEDGCLAVSEAVWLKGGAPREVRDFWDQGYPAMQDDEANLAAITRAGYRPLGHFTLPESAWWEYYEPIKAKLPAFRQKYRDVPEVAEVIAEEEREMELYRKYSEYYGYIFYTACLEQNPTILIEH
ncbi:MAG: class I SAM-dependent methyltransferase [Elusimicrobiota bacterium]